MVSTFIVKLRWTDETGNRKEDRGRADGKLNLPIVLFAHRNANKTKTLTNFKTLQYICLSSYQNNVIEALHNIYFIFNLKPAGIVFKI